MDDAINVPVRVRSNELAQAQNMTPRVVEKLRQVDAESVQERADDLERIYEEHIEGVEHDYRGNTDYIEFATHLSMPAEDWRTFIGALSRLRDEEGLRVWWLRKKFVNRLEDRLEGME